MEQMLREREQYFQRLIEHATDIIAVLDAEGVIRYASPSAFRVGGYGSDELVGLHLLALLHPEDAESTLRIFAEGVATGQGGRLRELRFRHKDGSYRILEAVGRYLLDDPIVRGVVINARDVTERRALERQLLQAQKMEAIGRLAGGVAHDFNNLLTAILASTDLLVEKLPAYHPAREDALETRKAALRAADLTRQLLAFSRQQVLQSRLLNLNEIVANIAKMLQRLLGEDIDLRTTLAPDLDAVWADAGQLEQVIMNVAINARDAMPDGGKLTIETANVALDEMYVAAHTPVVPGRYVMIAMSDTGVGMDDATKSRVFEPFFTTKPKERGTGLGLATVYGIVKQSGGYIWVYSEPGHGATFKIYLPLVDQPVAAAQTRAGDHESLRGSETVLLCEDEEDVRSLTRRILDAHGYDVLVAAGGEEALELADAWSGAIDLLLTDVVMPRMSGRELARRLGAKHPGMRVLYLSGYPDESIVRHGVLESGVAFLQKPFTADILARRVRQVLDA